MASSTGLWLAAFFMESGSMDHAEDGKTGERQEREGHGTGHQVMTAIASHPLFQIPSKDDPKELPDPFNDLSVGGWEITEEPVGRLSVWAVSLQGKVSHYHCAQDLTWQRRPAAGWAGAGVSQGGGRELIASCPWNWDFLHRQRVSRLHNTLEA